jgi:prepilin-type N-terminal cleavage/methylation domain-containing protein
MKRIFGRKESKYGKSSAGFSLVEVLVCIALLAIVCVPLLSGFRTSAVLNNKAHYTQKVTAYAQEELETIKTFSVEDYTAQFTGAGTEPGVTYTYIASDSDAEWVDLRTKADAIMSSFNPGVTLSDDKKKELFNPFICEKKGIQIGSKTYTMRASFMPAEYSQYDKRTSAAGVNVAGYFDIAEADAVKFPVITDEINQYDEMSAGILAAKLEEIGESKTEADILSNMKKTIDIDIQSSASEGTVDVRCDITYAYPAASPKAEANYCVYKASYELYPAVETGSLRIGAESGGSVFIMANAYRSLNVSCINELNIMVDGSEDVYLVAGHASGTEDIYNFNTITVNGNAYVDGYNVKAAVPGEMDTGTGGTFRSNIKQNGEKLDTTKEETFTIGNETYQTITYAVEITMYEETDTGTDFDTKVAHIEATKIDR